MEEYSKKRTIIILVAFASSVIFEILMVRYLNSYFDATYKVVIAAIISYILYLYIIVFGAAGVYCLILSFLHEEDNIFFSMWLIVVAIIIALGMFCYFSRNTIAVITETIMILLSILYLIGTVKDSKIKNREK